MACHFVLNCSVYCSLSVFCSLFVSKERRADTQILVCQSESYHRCHSRLVVACGICNCGCSTVCQEALSRDECLPNPLTHDTILPYMVAPHTKAYSTLLTFKCAFQFSLAMHVTGTLFAGQSAPWIVTMFENPL